MGWYMLHCRVTDEDRDRFAELAAKLDMSFSDMLRLAIRFWRSLDEAGAVDVLAGLRREGFDAFSNDIIAQIAGDYLGRLGAHLAFERRVKWESESIAKALAGGALTDAEKLYVEAVRASNARAIAFPAAVEALQRAGSLPADLSSQIDAEGLLRLWAMKQAGRLSQKQFDRELAEMQKFPFGVAEPDDDD